MPVKRRFTSQFVLQAAPCVAARIGTRFDDNVWRRSEWQQNLHTLIALTFFRTCSRYNGTGYFCSRSCRSAAGWCQDR